MREPTLVNLLGQRKDTDTQVIAYSNAKQYRIIVPGIIRPVSLKRALFGDKLRHEVASSVRATGAPAGIISCMGCDVG